MRGYDAVRFPCVRVFHLSQNRILEFLFRSAEEDLGRSCRFIADRGTYCKSCFFRYRFLLSPVAFVPFLKDRNLHDGFLWGGSGSHVVQQEIPEGTDSLGDADMVRPSCGKGRSHVLFTLCECILPCFPVPGIEDRLG